MAVKLWNSETAPRLGSLPGRPPGSIQRQRAWITHCANYIDTFGWPQLVRLAEEAKSERIQLEALRTILAYAYGQPRQSISVEAETRQSVTVYLPGQAPAPTVIDAEATECSETHTEGQQAALPPEAVSEHHRDADAPFS